MLFAILTIFGGLVAASSTIIARSPKSRQLFDSVAPYQGVLGLGLLGFGVYHLVFGLLPNLTALLQMPITMGLVTAGLALDISIGFALGFGLIRSWVSRSANAREKADRARARLVRIQVPLGISAVAVGALLLLGF